MKKKFTLSFIAIIITLVACKNNESQPQEVEVTENNQVVASYSGEYYYTPEGAVLQGDSFIYAVTLDEMAKQLAEKVAPVKKTEFDMVPVVVKGTVQKNPALTEGKQVWEQILTIKEIVTVSNQPAAVDIQLEEKKS